MQEVLLGQVQLAYFVVVAVVTFWAGWFIACIFLVHRLGNRPNGSAVSLKMLLCPFGSFQGRSYVSAR